MPETEHRERRVFERYVALGDSQTEGVGDGDDVTGLRGWADRLAELLAVANPRLQYANLAVRGRVARQVRSEQLGPALALRPDLVTVVAGVNDILRPRYEAVEVADELEAMFAALTASGAQVVTLAFPDLSKIAPMARPLAPRLTDLNARVRAAASRHGVTVVDTGGYAVTTDPRLWTVDRLHAGPLGHERIAAAVAHTLCLPGSDDAWSHPLPPLSAPGAVQALTAELRWAAGFLGPWIGRRLRGRSSGDGRSAKRPQLLPVGPPGPQVPGEFDAR
ncbi:SGNH/GDSL hydrolase family protein [Streptomyces sp. NPDC096193]|uniref:SGNH/GDSL hydrolase family protein n=1 Tax=Streptomyces sp. NPDC096193 TaxID=3155821 RepID=UPI00332E0692